MGMSPGRSALTTTKTAAIGPSTFKFETVEVSSFITSMARHQNTYAISAIVPRTETEAASPDVQSVGLYSEGPGWKLRPDR